MEHFAESIDGFFAKEDFQFYKFAVNQQQHKLKHVVEIGSYKGRSSWFMANTLTQLNTQVKFDCVDTWLGNKEHQHLPDKNDLFDTFQKNMEPFKNFYTAIRMTSVEASKLYADNSLDIVYIDAAHDYENVKSDILSWLPKVKIGGIISGHDYHPIWSGVVRAVDELIQDPIIFHNSTSWYKIKT